MKRFLVVAAITVAALVMFGILSRMNEAEAWNAATTPAPAETNGAAAVDIDFTKMNQTMQMTFGVRLLSAPKDYVGKIIRLTGRFLSRVDETDGKRYYGCQMGSAGCSCCSPGVLEFVPKKSYVWPDGFPQMQSPVTVTGRLEMYDIPYEGQKYTMPHLVDADIRASD